MKNHTFFNTVLPESLLLINLAILLLFASLGKGIGDLFFLIIANSLLLNLYSYAVGGKLAIPRFFRSFVVFILVLFFHTLFAHGYWDFFELFFAGGVFWFTAYNFPESISKKIPGLIMFLGYMTGLAFLYNFLSGTPTYNFASLSFTPSAELQHSRIGDFWATILVAVSWQAFQTKKFARWLTILIGIFFLVVSESRSAIVALAAGIYYIFYKSGFNAKYRKVFYLFLAAVVLIFMTIGATKTTLFDRSYFVAAIWGIAKNPLGTGMGRFLDISQAFKNAYPTIGVASEETHNIILEFILGMGIFSVFFLYWLAQSVILLFKDKKIDILFSAIFITILVNFLFTDTYSIPVFILVWFICLGTIQRGIGIDK